MKHNVREKLLAVVMAAAIFGSMFPNGALAAEQDASEQQTQTAETDDAVSKDHQTIENVESQTDIKDDTSIKVTGESDSAAAENADEVDAAGPDVEEEV